MLYFKNLSEKSSQTAVAILPALLFALKRCTLSMNDSDESLLEFFDTEKYRCHFYETISGYWFAILSSPDVPVMRRELFFVYKEIFLKFVVQNPDWNVGDVIENLSVFDNEIAGYLTSLKQ